MQFRDEIVIAASAERIFSFYADVNNWPSWDPDTRSATLQGDFVSGSTALLELKNGPKAMVTFTEVLRNKGFTAESRLPLCTLCFGHELFGNKHGIKVVHSVRFKGLLAPLFYLLLGSNIKKGLPHALQGLREAIEQSV